MKMTLEEMFCDLYDKYGNDFNWYMIPFTQADGAFVAELNKEIGPVSYTHLPFPTLSGGRNWTRRTKMPRR